MRSRNDLGGLPGTTLIFSYLNNESDTATTRPSYKNGFRAGQGAITETRHEMEAMKSREIEWFHGICTAIQRGEETRERGRILLGRLAWVVRKPDTCAEAITLPLRWHQTMVRALQSKHKLSIMIEKG